MNTSLRQLSCVIALTTCALAQDAPPPPPPGQAAAPGPGRSASAPRPRKVSCDRLRPRPQAQMPLPLRRPRADRMQAPRLHLRLGRAIRPTMRAVLRLLHPGRGADRLRRHRRRRRISGSLVATLWSTSSAPTRNR